MDLLLCHLKIQNLIIWFVSTFFYVADKKLYRIEIYYVRSIEMYDLCFSFTYFDGEEKGFIIVQSIKCFLFYFVSITLIEM